MSVRLSKRVWMSLLLLCINASSVLGQGMLMPLYIYPSSPSVWQPLVTAATNNPDVHFIAIVNPDSGPGVTPTLSSAYQSAITLLRTKPNISVIGYVATTFGGKDIATVKADVLKWSSSAFMGSVTVDGIFFDESAASATASFLTYYQSLYQYVKSLPFSNQTWSKLLIANKLVVLNPGTVIDRQYLLSTTPSADMVVQFESYWSCVGVTTGCVAWQALAGTSYYLPSSLSSEKQYVSGNSRVQNVVMVHGCPSISDLVTAVNAALVRNMGYVFVTDQRGGDAYHAFPSYISNEGTYLTTLYSGGTPLSPITQSPSLLSSWDITALSILLFILLGIVTVALLAASVVLATKYRQRPSSSERAKAYIDGEGSPQPLLGPSPLSPSPGVTPTVTGTAASVTTNTAIMNAAMTASIPLSLDTVKGGEMGGKGVTGPLSPGPMIALHPLSPSGGGGLAGKDGNGTRAGGTTPSSTPVPSTVAMTPSPAPAPSTVATPVPGVATSTAAPPATPLPATPSAATPSAAIPSAATPSAAAPSAATLSSPPAAAPSPAAAAPSPSAPSPATLSPTPQSSTLTEVVVIESVVETSANVTKTSVNDPLNVAPPS